MIVNISAYRHPLNFDINMKINGRSCLVHPNKRDLSSFLCGFKNLLKLWSNVLIFILFWVSEWKNMSILLLINTHRELKTTWWGVGWLCGIFCGLVCPLRLSVFSLASNLERFPSSCASLLLNHCGQIAIIIGHFLWQFTSKTIKFSETLWIINSCWFSACWVYLEYFHVIIPS